jgi:hypothetical protein
MVWLDGRQFDDSVGELLRRQKQIWFLSLAGNDVTDTHLARMHGMSVQRVELTDTSVTSAGIEALKESLPDCQVRVYSTSQTTTSKPPG